MRNKSARRATSPGLQTRGKMSPRSEKAKSGAVEATAAKVVDSAARSNLLIRASAGTGKTYQLSGHYIDRLRDQSPERIVATTFTRPAAAEILERVLLRLSAAATDPAAFDDLSRQLAQFRPEPFKRADCLRLLANVTRELHRTRVGTLDSFFIQLAQSCSLELGLPPGWGILDDLGQQQIEAEAIERLLQEHSRDELSPLLNLLARGDAGRSVTRLMRDAVREFHEIWLDSDAAAWERVPRPAPLSQPELEAAFQRFDRLRATTNKTCANRMSKDIELLSVQDWESFLHAGIANCLLAGILTFSSKEIPAEVVEAYTPLVQHARAILLTEFADRTLVTRKLLDKYDAIVTRLKEERLGLTFSDVTRSIGTGWDRIEAARIDYRLDAGIDHLLLDEFQDTSTRQWQALEPLARRVAEHPAASLFCVGDQKQAIYGWRGGVAELFDVLPERLSNLRHEPLSQSYRSSPAVVEAVNRICTQIANHPELADDHDAVARWQSRFPEHSTAKADLPGWVTLETARDAESDSVIEATADRVAELTRESPGLSIGVLVRRNDAAAAVARLLRQRGIDVSEEGRSALVDSVSVGLILSLLQVADHPGDSLAWHHLATSPLGAALQLPSEYSKEEATLCAAGWRRDLLDRGYAACISNWALLMADACDVRGVERLRQFIDVAAGYDALATLRPRDFIDYVEAQTVLQPTTAAVRVMTIHHSKGLEFDVVFLADLDGANPKMPSYVSGRATPVDPPHTVMRYANKAIQEILPASLKAVVDAARERRTAEQLCLLYVALTRARCALHLMIQPSKENEGKLNKSLAHLLRAAVTDGQPLKASQQLTITGNARWRDGWSRAASSEAPGAASADGDNVLTIVLAPSRSSIGRVDDAVAPSQTAAEVRRIDEVLRPEAAGALDKGTLLHSWFERIGFVEDEVPTDEVLRNMARRWELDDDNVAACLAEFHAALKHPRIAHLLSRRGNLGPEGPFAKSLAEGKRQADYTIRFRNERRFLVPIDGQLVNGVIDRLVLLEQAGRVVAADLVDYKTDVLGVLKPAGRQARLDKYQHQLDLYARGIAAVYNLPLERVSARLVLTHQPEVIVVR
jgi:ATP-dependent helicase/nuclease subunit A